MLIVYLLLMKRESNNMVFIIVSHVILCVIYFFSHSFTCCITFLCNIVNVMYLTFSNSKHMGSSSVVSARHDSSFISPSLMATQSICVLVTLLSLR